MSSPPVYTDQFGRAHAPGPDSVFKPRRGAFAICIYNDHILLSWSPWAPELAEFPGGGIDPGEDAGQALIREIAEEAAVQLPAIEADRVHEQHVKYYASSTNEFWDYDQQYWVVKPGLLRDHFFRETRYPPDAVSARWVPLSEFKTMKIHAMHERARVALGLSPGRKTMRMLFALFIVMFMAGPAYAEKACTEMWCREGFALALEGTAWAPGKYEFYIKADDTVVTCTATLPLRSDCAASAQCSHPDWSIGESGCALPADAQGFHEISATVIPKHVRVEITGPDAKTARVELPVTAQCGYPNGRECDQKQCCGATARMAVEWR